MTTISELLGRSPTASAALALLVSLAGREVHTREIARRIHADPHSTQLALNHLLQAGAVISSRVGNLRMWAVNRTDARVESIQGLLRNESSVVETLREGFDAMRHVQLALVFGSFASGLDTPNSDVDVLLVGMPSWDHVAPLSEAVAVQTGRDLNLVTWTRDDLMNLKPGQMRLLRSILSNPRIVLKGDERELGTAAGRSMATEVRRRHRGTLNGHRRVT